MHNITEEYTKIMKGQIRPKPLVKISYGIINDDGEKNTKSYARQMEWANADLVDTGVSIKQSYATFEKKRFKTKINSGLILVPEDKETNQFITDEHYISEVMSTKTGVFIDIPFIDIEFTEPLELYGITLIFDSFGKTYAKDIKVSVYNATGEVLKEEEVANSSYEFSYPLKITNIKRIRVEFLSTGEPYQRVRIESLEYGLYKVFREKDLDSSGINSHTREISLISNNLSRSELDFTILNMTDEYNILNPNGLWKYAEENQPVKIEFGRTLPNGSEEWLRADTMYLADDIVSSATNVKFSAVDKLSTLTTEYYKSQYIGLMSLYDLAVNVFTFLGLDELEYSIDDRLKGYRTYGIVEPMPANEVLQLIANASNSIVYADSDSIMHIDVAYDPIVHIEDNGHASNSTTDAVINSKNSGQTIYGNFDLDSMEVNEKHIDMITPEDSKDLTNYGYISNHIAKDNGTFETEPKLTITYSLPIDVFQIPITFNSAKKEYATSFTMIYSDSYEELARVDVNDNSLVTYFMQRAVQNVTKIELIIHKWSVPYHRCVVNRIGEGRINDFYLDYQTAFVDPVINKNRLIKSLTIEYQNYQVAVEPTTVEVEHNKEYVIEVNHSAMTNMSVQVTSGTVTKQEHYAFKSFITVDTLDIEKITLTGYELVPVAQTVNLEFNKAGEPQYFSNPLINDYDRAKSVGNWIYDYISKANTMNIPYRGNPEIEPYDTIYVQSKYDPYTPVRIKRTRIDFQQGLTGELEVLKI